MGAGFRGLQEQTAVARRRRRCASRRLFGGAQTEELRAHEAGEAAGPSPSPLLPRFRLIGEVLRAATIGEGEPFAHQKRAHVAAAGEAERELARVAIDIFAIHMAGEVWFGHKLAQALCRDGAAGPDRAARIAAGLRALEGIDAIEAKPLAETTDAEPRQKAT